MTKESYIFGTSLISALVCLSIVAIVMQFSLFNLQPLLAQNRLENHMSLLRRALGAARHKAMDLNDYVTVCSLESNYCQQNNWHQTISIFVDNNSVGVFESDDTLLFQIDPVHSLDSLTYPRTSLTFRPDGTPAGFNNGTFVYCPQFDQAKLTGQAISISYTGRTRLKQTKKCQQ